ncbi:MAG: Ldh family oxidoreductase [Propylenella sp.]
MRERTVTLDEAEALAAGALTRSRTAEPAARSVARALVGAEAIGQIGHGLRRVAAYAAQSAAGKVDGFATPVASETAPGILAVDAASGFAYPALDLAVERLPDLVARQGIAMAAVRRSHHCGALGLVVEALAERGLVALMFANTPAAIAPWGGRTALFGTNPIAFAAPLDSAPPVVVDLSLSKVARGKIMAARQRGERIPEGWAFDAEGRATTDPAAALVGTMAPVGDAKGTALALMVEFLVAGLAGANFSYEATSFFDAEGAPPGVGQIILAIDPSRAPGGSALRRFAELAERIEAESGARLPGRQRQVLRRRAESEGIQVDETLLNEIAAISR